MKKLLLIIAIILFATTTFAANTQTSASTSAGRYEAASVDTDPGANGYGTKSISIQYTRGMQATELWFDIYTIGTGATITLQRSPDNVTFYDMQDGDYTEIGGWVIHDATAGTYYKLWVKDDAQGSGGASLFRLKW